MVKISKLDDFSIGTWNGCGWDSSIDSALSSSLQELDIVALTEMKQKDENAVLTGRLLKSGGGGVNDPAAGVGLLLSQKAQKAMIFANAISPRILMARFEADQRNITVIVVYIPHQGRNLEPFQSNTYAELEKAIAAVSKRDCLIIAGDFNSRLERSWKDNNFMDAQFVGRWSVHNRDCPGGTLLRDLLHKYDFADVSTMFQPRKQNRSKQTNNGTWINPNHSFKPAQIDHLLVSRRWKSSFTSCCVKWGPSIRRWGEKRDHGVLVAKATVRTRTAHVPNRRFTTDKLKDEPTQLKFAEAVRRRIVDHVDMPIPLTVDGRWLRLKSAISSVAKETLKPDKNPYKFKGYVSEKTVKLVTERVARFEAADTVTDDLRKEWKQNISRSLREDWKAHVTNIVRQMEEADSVGNVRKVHELAGRLQGKGKRASSNLSTDEERRPLVTEAERLAVWQRYYATKFSTAPSTNPPYITIPIAPGKVPPTPMSMTAPSRKEVADAINSLSKGKSPGHDDLPIDLFCASPAAIDEMTAIVIMIWEEETLPKDWSEGLMVNIYKGKGSKNMPVSYRPICLLVHAYKAFALVLLRRMLEEIDARIVRGQEGFRNGRGCSDNLYTLRAAIRHAIKSITDVQISFVDFTQAFDTISHDFLKISLEEHNVPPKYVRLILMIYANATAKIKGANGNVSDPFDVNRGVLQGDVLSPILFIMVLNSMWARTNPHDGWQVAPDWLLNELSYADDCAIVEGPGSSPPDNTTHTIDNSQRRLQEFSDVGKVTSTMRINVPKTFHMKVEPVTKIPAATLEDITTMNFETKCPDCGRSFPSKKSLPSHSRYCPKTHDAPQKPYRNQKANMLVQEKKRAAIIAARPNIILDLLKIGNVAQFQYLGALVAGSGNDSKEITARIHKAQGIFNAHAGIWSDKDLDMDIKIRLFKVRVLMALLYGSESWKMTPPLLRNLRGFSGRCHIKMANTSFSKNRRARNNTMGEKMKSAIKSIDITRMLEKRRWSWLGHVLRMNPDRNPRRALALEFGTLSSITEHLPAHIRDIETATLLAADRENWSDMFKENRYRSFEDIYHALPNT